MAQIYQIISIVAFSLMGVALLLAVIFWFKFDVWKLMGDLSGRTARKSIENMRQQNQASTKKTYRPMPTPLKVQEDIQLKTNVDTEATDLLDENKKSHIQEEKTELLDMETELLETETQMLDTDTEILDSGTDVLDEGTEVLGMETEVLGMDGSGEKFEYLQNIVFIHTNETI